jgi:hypothetical protein
MQNINKLQLKEILSYSYIYLMQDLTDSDSELEYEGIDFNNEHLTYVKEFPITPIYNTFFPNILPDDNDNDDFDYSDMPELISLDSESESDLDVATDSIPSLNLETTLNINLDEIKRNIESTVNEGLDALNNPDQLMNRIQDAFDSFKSQTGRTMTYSEMRQMMG